MDSDVSNELSSSERFWEELDAIVNTPCDSQQAIDNSLKTYLAITSQFAPQHLCTDYDWARCAYVLLEAPLFRKHKGYVRKRMIGRLRKENANSRVHLVARILLYEGRGTQKTFELMQEEGLFIRLLALVREKREEDRMLWAVSLDLLYEMSRIQRLRADDLDAIDDDFVQYLFQVVEEDPDDPEDPYHYPVIRMMLVLNEQYMVSAHAPNPTKTDHSTPTNKIIKTLCQHGSDYKTFGENIILLINRESETCLQLLILKLLYLLFTTSATYEYFYSNDLRVLVDVIIRNLLDLPEEAEALRHTYLRVLYPLLNHSQLKRAPYYKKQELLDLFSDLSGTDRSSHFEPADPTTIRLVSRCMTVSWLRPPPSNENPDTPARRFLGMSLAHMGESSLSVAEVTAQSEKPGVLMPSRSRNVGASNAPASGAEHTTQNGREIAGEA